MNLGIGLRMSLRYARLNDGFETLLNVRELIHWGGIVGITGIIFVETGLFLDFLPGDSLVTKKFRRRATRYRTATRVPNARAIAGDQTGYAIGRTQKQPGGPLSKSETLTGPRILRTARDNTTVIARFVPIIRTFAPAVRAVKMRYRSFVYLTLSVERFGFQYRSSRLWCRQRYTISTNTCIWLSGCRRSFL
jgi:hypothetical protein